MSNVPTTGEFAGDIFGAGNAQPAATPGDCDVQASLLDCLYRLGFQPAGDLGATSWVTPAELLQFADDEAKKLSGQGLVVQWDTSVAVTAGNPVYSQPAPFIATILAAFLPVAGAVQILRLTSPTDLWALDGNWPATTGVPQRLSAVAGGLNTATLYPNPTGAGTLGQLCQEYPPTVAAAATTLPFPTVLQDLFTYAQLAGAKGKESDQADMGMAKHYQQRVSLYESIAAHLWGAGS